MKICALLLCLVIGASARPARGKGDKSGEGQMAESGPEFPMPEGEMKPLTAKDVTELLGNVHQFAGKVKQGFAELRDDADKITGSEEDLDKLAGKVRSVVAALKKDGQEGAEALGAEWMKKMMRLVFAGVEDEGQCHKVLEYLIGAMEEAEGAAKREMGAEELEFWQGVAKAGKAEVGCIVDRFNEFMSMVEHVQDAIENPPAGYNENGHAFEAEVLMGSLYFGFGHLYRQVAVFTHVMDALLNYEEAQVQNSKRGDLALFKILESAKRIQATMDDMKDLKSKARF